MYVRSYDLPATFYGMPLVMPIVTTHISIVIQKCTQLNFHCQAYIIECQITHPLQILGWTYVAGPLYVKNAYGVLQSEERNKKVY